MPIEKVAHFRRLAGATLVDNAFRVASASTAFVPPSWPSWHGLERVRSVRYHGSRDPAHLLDVYLPSPEHQGPRPVVVYYHGGGFRILSKESHWLMGIAFAREGYVTMVPDYRKAPAHTYPAAHEDAFRAYRWAVEHAEAFGGDPSRIVVAGESAGANLAASISLASCWERPEPFARAVFEVAPPAAVVAMCGFLEISDPRRLKRRKRLPLWLDDRVTEVAEAYLGDMGPGGAGHDLADPLIAFERGDPPDRPLPPFCLSVGTRDPLLDDTRRMVLALQRLGVEVDVGYYPGEVHAFQAFLWRKNARRSWVQTFRFLDRVLPR